ncbi:hypothetical protein [Massilia sp. TWR1-2-2]|uniref:hypothetical protein n=1 Tax=Massilia sp. TWR1-2-2 TaxID=2804584 RepID=UPI003CE993E2
MQKKLSVEPANPDPIFAAIVSQGEKIGRLLQKVAHPPARQALTEYFFTPSEETFDRALQVVTTGDAPIQEWNFGNAALCRAIDDYFAAGAALEAGNLEEALAALIGCATSLGVHEGVLITSLLRAKKGGVARHHDTPNFLAKKFIRECWDEWQSNPMLYRTQTDFATDMMSKVPTDHSGKPVVSFDTIVKKWVPMWVKAKK